MNRRAFLKTGGSAALLTAVAAELPAQVPVHNFDHYDFGSGPPITDRLYQGPFAADQYPSWEVVMALTPAHEVVPNYGLGLTTYVGDETGPPQVNGQTLAQTLEDLVKLPLGTKLYIRVNWKDVQQQPGRLDPSQHWMQAFDLAKQYHKRIAFRVMLSNPDIPGLALPEFVLQKVPMIKLGDWQQRTRYEPRYDHPAFQSAFRELIDLLADAYDGHSDVEFVDTCMYGFWGEGHTWPLENNPFPDYHTAESTFLDMLEYQLAHWKKTPLLTNTQPDFSKVGNFALLDRSVRSGNWLRTDTIFIENEQVEELSNRPPWIGVAVEVGMSDGSPASLKLDEGVPYTDNVAHHVQDAGACYFSLWNWHHIHAQSIQAYYDQYPHALDELGRRIGYRVRPSWVWSYNEGGYPGLIVGFANDGVAAVPGALRISVTSPGGKVYANGSLDPGYPLAGKVRQAKLPLPKGLDWKGLHLKAELEVKGQRHPVRWACHQRLNEDGSLTLRPTAGLGVDDITGGVPPNGE